MAHRTRASRAPEQPVYAVPQLRLTAGDVERLADERLTQRREELALSPDEVFARFRSLNRIADWMRSARPVG